MAKPLEITESLTGKTIYWRLKGGLQLKRDVVGRHDIKGEIICIKQNTYEWPAYLLDDIEIFSIE